MRQAIFPFRQTINIMIRPITCPQCKTRVGQYDNIRGVLTAPTMPVPVFGAYLPCKNCGKRVTFNGERVRKIAKRKSKVSEDNL